MDLFGFLILFFNKDLTMELPVILILVGVFTVVMLIQVLTFKKYLRDIRSQK
ncbi:MAG: hypothetical protein ACYDEE_02435 [Ignavibacteriaceae bacterium]